MFTELMARQATMSPERFAELLGMQQPFNGEGTVDPETGHAQNNRSINLPYILGAQRNPDWMGQQSENGQSNDTNPEYLPYDTPNGMTLWEGPGGNKTYAQYALDANGNQIGRADVQDLRGQEAGSYMNMAAILGAGAAAGGAFNGLGGFGTGANAAGGSGSLGELASLGGSAQGFGLPMAEGLSAGGAGAGLSSLTPEALAGLTPESFAAMAGSGTADGGSLASLLGGGANGGSGLSSLLGGGGIAGPLARLGGSALQAYTASKAANAQTQAGNQALDVYKGIYDQNRADMAPYRQIGTDAIGQLRDLMADPNKVTEQPGYQFGLQQGQQAMEHGAAARGMQLSGAALKGAQRYGQDYAGTKLDQTYNRLSNLAGLGQVGQSVQAAQNYGNNVGNTVQNMGNVRGSSYVAQGNALAGGLSGYAQNQQDQDLLRNLLNRPGP